MSEATTLPCQRCGASIRATPPSPYPQICDACYTLAGSCCQDWEEQPEDRADPATPQP